MGEKKKKIIKTIKVDADKCNGCRACEVICSAFHAQPKYSSNNPARSRIRIIRYPLKDIYIPVYAGEYTAAECMGRDKYVLDGKGIRGVCLLPGPPVLPGIFSRSLTQAFR